MFDSHPIRGRCGWSGAGKTTVIERVIPLLNKKNLSVAVVKHDAHGVTIDKPGKDSDRFFQAGADVLLQGPGQACLRTHRGNNENLDYLLNGLVEDYDLILVEGHKSTPLQKVWLLNDDESDPPPEANNVRLILTRTGDRQSALIDFLDDFVTQRCLSVPLIGCVPIGGKSKRMGSPKHLLEKEGQTWLERTVDLLNPLCSEVVFLGAGEIPESLHARKHLPDVPDAQGPMAGLLAAMRWNPRASFLVTACDLPHLSEDALNWLLEVRMPGVWGTLPRLPGARGIEPLLAHYDFRSRNLLERMALQENYKLNDLFGFEKIMTPLVPEKLEGAWRNVNQMSELT